MTKYREILRLTALGLSQRNIMQSIKASQKTVVKVQRRAQELKLTWPLNETLTDSALEKLMFPKNVRETTSRKMIWDGKGMMLMRMLLRHSRQSWQRKNCLRELKS